jgi:hypothetical protein
MPINPSLLIAAPMLQDFLIDKTGVPMAAGIVTCYHDNSRTTLKNWYYQSGTPGNYTYIPLPNPLTLSAAGTIEDINGVDTIPFFYPYLESDQTVRDPYYITVVNSTGTNQITRQNFPFLGTGSATSSGTTLNNLIANGAFWRNIMPNLVNQAAYASYNLSEVTSIVVAPSQHDGYRLPDINFVKNNTAATDAVTFTPFPIAIKPVIANDITPEYYLSHNCSAAGAGETSKYYSFPIYLHVNTLANIPFTVSIQAQNGATGSGVGQNVITLSLLQDLGTGQPAATPIPLTPLTLSTTWTTYSASGVFPAVTGTLSGAGDDAMYLLVELPVDLTCTINFTKPCIYLTQNIVSDNTFQTYDQIDSIISSPRTGDVRYSMNAFYNYGWAPLNDGGIGNAMSNASSYAQQDAWSLFNLMWTYANSFPNSAATIIPIFTSTNVPSTYGTSAINDWNANKVLQLPQTLANVLLGTVPGSAIKGSFTSSFTGTSSGGNLLITTPLAVDFYTGMPIYFTGNALPSAITQGTIYWVAAFNGTTQFNVSTSFANVFSATFIPYAGAPATGTVFGTTAAINYGVSDTQSILFASNTNPGSTLFPFNVSQPMTFMNMYMKL